MKSTIEDLAKRGYVSIEEIKQYNELTKAEIINCLSSALATQRTIATYYLSSTVEEDIQLLLKQLKNEKCLYTKIAICEKLQTGNPNTAQLMITMLGKIGKNQYTSLPKHPSKKKSYPLPRDIIARTLGRMDKSTLPVLLNVLKSGDIVQLREVLDAIGLMVFYEPALATDQNVKYIYDIFNEYKDDLVVLWKAITCLSVFPQTKSISILKEYMRQPGILGEEAQRSLKLMKNRK